MTFVMRAGLVARTVVASAETVERAAPGQAAEPVVGEADAAPWQVIVWNDPVNLMSYVSMVFQKHFGYSAAKAHRLMLQVHEDGKAIVFSGTLEMAEQHTHALHQYGLWATFEQPQG